MRNMESPGRELAGSAGAGRVESPAGNHTGEGSRRDWRQLLPQLIGLPLLPIGAGKEGKAPINPVTGQPMTRWETAAYSPDQIAAMNGVVRAVGSRCGPDAGGLLTLDLDGSSTIEEVRRRGYEPTTATTWGINRTTTADRLKLVFRVPHEHWPLLTKGKAKRTTGTREQIEAFWSAGQVILLGEHRPSGGQYVWHGSPSRIETMAPGHPLWPLVLELLGTEPAPAPRQAPPPPAAASDNAIPLEQLLSREHSRLWQQGAPEGGRNDALFTLAVGLATAAQAAAQAGLRTVGDPEDLAMAWAASCSPPLPDPEARQTIASALRQCRTPDAGMAKRIAYHQRKRPGPSPPPHSPGEPRGRQEQQQQAGEQPDQQRAESFSLESYRSDWLPLVMEHVFTSNGERWICVENVLHQWTGTHYGPVADLELAPKVAKFLGRLSYFDVKAGEDVHHWARPSRVDEAIQWLKKRTAASIKDFNPSNALNLQNGVLTWSWEDRRLVTRLDPHDPAQRFTYCQGYSYDPDASRDTLDRLLQAVEDSEQDTFQRVMGSGLELARYRATQGRPRAILAIGDGQNGKDTLQGAMSETLGNRGFTHCSIGDFQQYDRGRKFPLAPLYGSRINWSSENTGYARLESIQSLKTAITGDPMSYEVKNVQEIPYSPNTLLIFNCNDPPRLDASSAAMESRWHVMAFRKRFTSRPDPAKPNELQADPRLKDDHQFIREAVCPAMLNWLLEGLQLAVLEGITYDPDSEALEAVRRQSCHLFEFADDARLVADPGGQVEASYVFELLWNWYQAQRILHVDPSTKRPTWNTHDLGGDPPVKIPRDLAARLRAVFPELRSERGTDKSRRSVLHGVRFVTTDTSGGGIEAPGGGTAEARAEA